jgi:cytochrome P450
MGATRYPPGPRGHFLSGNLPEFRRNRLDFLTRCARDYGDIVSIRLGPRRIFLLSHPDLIEYPIVTGNQHFIKHWALRLNPLVLGNGLLTSSGPFWLRQRRLMQPAFQRSRIATYVPVMAAHTQQMLASWQAGQTCDILTEMMRLTLAIAAKTLFDAEATGQAAEVSAALGVLQEAFRRKFNSILPVPVYIPTPGNLRLRRAVRRLDEIIYGFIQQRRQSSTAKGDLLSLLLHARDEQDHTGMTDKQLRDEAMTLFLAGHETTALTLAWSWYLLSQNPEAETRLAAEVQEVLGGRSPGADDLSRLVYTEKVVREAMRLYPPVYVFGREASHECEIGGYQVPAGHTLMMSQWVVHRDPRFWERPEQFEPERWTDELERRLPKFAYFPFGGGPRLCIGETFAMMETVLILASIAQQFRFTIQPGQPVVPTPIFTLRPQPGIPAILTRR